MTERDFASDFYSVWARGTSLYVRWSARHGISYTELSVLYALITKGSTTQKAICEFYGLPKQTVNHCMRHFEQKRYIRLKANEQDKREKIIILTEVGEKYAQDILEPLFKIEAYICRNISSDKFVQAIETRELFNLLFEKEMDKETLL